MKTTIDTLSKPFLFIYLSLGFVWLRSFYEKLISGNFPDTIGFVLTKFANKNPYPWYKKYLETFAIPNAKAYGYLIMWGEGLTAVAILGALLFLFIQPKENKFATALLLLGLIGGIFLNGNFWLASGWMSPAGDTLNIFMFAIEVIGCITAIVVLTR